MVFEDSSCGERRMVVGDSSCGVSWKDVGESCSGLRKEVGESSSRERWLMVGICRKTGGGVKVGGDLSEGIGIVAERERIL